MLTKEDFNSYKHQSYFLKLKKLAQDTANPFEFKMIFFGGTGAVGGQAVIEILEAFSFIKLNNVKQHRGQAELIITGLDVAQIHQFTEKLHLVFGEEKFTNISTDKENPSLLFDELVHLNFHVLRAEPKFEVDLNAALNSIDDKETKISYLISQASNITAPFQAFIHTLKQSLKLPTDYQFQAVFSGIPIPSVATYHFEAIDVLLEKHGLSNIETERNIKQEILKGLAQDFGQIKEKHAKEVLIAHTTSVGGMYQIIDNESVIKTGYAHSSLGTLLKEKQFYANVLTIHYSNFGLKSLVTAAAIGIDFIYPETTLPLSSGVSRKYRTAEAQKMLPFDFVALQEKDSPRLINPILSAKSENLEEFIQSKDASAMNFEQYEAPLQINYALRSGENGLFSLDNAYALYLNMKIASQEELAHVMVFNALFGDDELKPWFNQHGICYYTQTDNSSLIFALLNNRHEFRKHQTSAFSIKAFQELGSSKHQAELHTWSLFILLHKIKSLRNINWQAIETLPQDSSSIEKWIDDNSPILTIENLVEFQNNLPNLAQEFATLLTISSEDTLANMIGMDEKTANSGFLKGLHRSIRKKIDTITTLGTPIVFTNKEGKDTVLCGAYFAPLDILLSHHDSVTKRIQEVANQFGHDPKTLLDWVICNNGGIDLRNSAILNTAASFNQNLQEEMKYYNTLQEFRAASWELKLRNGANVRENIHVTSSGLIAYVGRMIGLLEMLQDFNIKLGTFNGWKALFPISDKGEYVLIPGIVEAMRHYTEGLGKITGTEFLYPKYGYFEKP